jgi:hypothetical protein
MCTPTNASVEAAVSPQPIPADAAPVSVLDPTVDTELAGLTADIMGELKFDPKKELRAFLLTQDPNLNPEGADALCEVLLEGINRLVVGYDADRLETTRVLLVSWLERRGVAANDLTLVKGKLETAKVALLKALEERKD